MKEHNALPKPARDQLARDQRAGEGVHPDADVLTAFSEGALGEAERGRMLEHISSCSECREVVFLAAPETVLQAKPVAAPVVSGWRRFMPAVAAAVALIVVGSAVLLNREHSPLQTLKSVEVEVKREPVPQPQAASSEPERERSSRDFGAAAPSKAAATKNEAAPGTVGALQQQRKENQTKSGNSAILQNQQLAAAGPHGSVEPKGSVSNYQRVAVTPPRSAPAPQAVGGTLAGNADGRQRYLVPGAQNQVVQGAASPVAVQEPDVKGKLVAPTTTPDLRLQNRSVVGIAPIPPRATASKPAGAPPAPAASETVEVTAEAAQVSRTDQLQAKKTAGFADAASLRRDAVAARAHWRITQDGALQRSFGNGEWSPMLTDTNAKFRVVSTIGSVVWAGGERGALYRSLDSGAHWTPIMVGDGGAWITQPVTAIHFRDVANGEVTFERGGVWETSDGGAHWTRRN